MANIIEAKELTKRYGDFVAVDAISFSVVAGETFGILGPNGAGKTIVLTTHYMEEAEVLCDRIAIMDHAKIIALDTPRNLLREAGVDSTVAFHVDRMPDLERFRHLPGVQQAIQEDHGYRLVSTDVEKTLPALFTYEAEAGFTIFDLRLTQATLEDVFLKMTGRTLRD